MSTIKNICVYCGSSPGTDPRFTRDAATLGGILAEQGIGVVYGGGSVGLMGAVSSAAIAKGGRVIGVIPEGYVEAELNVLHQRLIDEAPQRVARAG